MIELKKCTAKTDQGPYLQINEDAYDFDLDKNLFMVLDGFGGSGIGDKCVGEIKEDMKSFFGRVSQDPDSTLPFFFSSKYLLETNALMNALFYIHKKVLKENMTKKVNQKAGAAGIFMTFSEELLCLCSTGNVSSFILRDGHLNPIFLPDTIECLSSDYQIERHFKTAPLSGIGLFQDLHYQLKEMRVKTGDSVVVMSDGVYSYLEENEISHVLNKGIETKEKINTLFKLSNSRGNFDNQTLMILDF